MGVPGETESDIEDTIRFIIDHKHYISEVFNISPFYLMQGNIYWNEPEKHGIRFIGDKDHLYYTYFHGIPDRYWYSESPYIDGSVRRKRAYKVMTILRKAGVSVAAFAENSVMRPMFDGFQNLRDLAVEVPSLMSCQSIFSNDTVDDQIQLTNFLQNRIVIRGSNLFFAAHESHIPLLRACTGNLLIHP